MPTWRPQQEPGDSGMEGDVEEPPTKSRGRAANPDAAGRRGFLKLKPREHDLWIREKWTPDASRNTAQWTVVMVSVLSSVTPSSLTALPSHIQHHGFLPLCVYIVLFSVASTYTMCIIARTMTITGQNTLSGMWSEVCHGVNWARRLPLLLTMFVCFTLAVGSLDQASRLISDVFVVSPQKVDEAYARKFGITPQHFWAAILGACPTAPFCILKDLSKMRCVMLMSILGALVATAVIVLRAVDGSYGPRGHFQPTSAAKPGGSAAGSPPMPMVVLAAVAFLTQQNGCKFYRELRNHDKGSFTRGISLGMAAGAVVILAGVGASHATFGDRCAPQIMDSYSRSDPLAQVARAALGVAFLGAIPLAFSGLREATVDLLKDFIPRTAHIFDTIIFLNTLSVAGVCLVVVTSCSSIVPGLVALGRGCGLLEMYVVPCVLLAFVSRNKYLGNGHLSTWQSALLFTITVVGTALASWILMQSIMK